MLRYLCACIVLTLSVCGAEPIRFVTMDLYATSEAPIAAWQIELAGDPATVAIVGLEGGDSAAYRQPPFYDRQALGSGRLVIAAYSTDADALPSGRTRLARLHLQLKGEIDPPLTARLIAAGTTNGSPIILKLKLQPATPEPTE